MTSNFKGYKFCQKDNEKEHQTWTKSPDLRQYWVQVSTDTIHLREDKIKTIKTDKNQLHHFSFLDFGFLISQNTGDHVHVSFSLLESWLLYKHASRVPISVMNTCFEKVLAQIQTPMKFQSLNTINKTISYTISRPKKSSNWPIKSTKYDQKKIKHRKENPTETPSLHSPPYTKQQTFQSEKVRKKSNNF